MFRDLNRQFCRLTRLDTAGLLHRFRSHHVRLPFVSFRGNSRGSEDEPRRSRPYERPSAQFRIHDGLQLFELNT